MKIASRYFLLCVCFLAGGCLDSSLPVVDAGGFYEAPVVHYFVRSGRWLVTPANTKKPRTWYFSVHIEPQSQTQYIRCLSLVAELINEQQKKGWEVFVKHFALLHNTIPIKDKKFTWSYKDPKSLFSFTLSGEFVTGEEVKGTIKAQDENEGVKALFETSFQGKLGNTTEESAQEVKDFCTSCYEGGQCPQP